MEKQFQSNHAGVTSFTIEEMDLFVKWTGPLSQRHVLRSKLQIRTTQDNAVTRSWSRLDEGYGCPEMM